MSSFIFKFLYIYIYMFTWATKLAESHLWEKHYFIHNTFFIAQQPPRGPGPPSLSRLQLHTQTHDTRLDSSGQVISPTQGPLPDNTQHSQETDILLCSALIVVYRRYREIYSLLCHNVTLKYSIPQRYSDFDSVCTAAISSHMSASR
jgi:hypothetical protein